MMSYRALIESGWRGLGDCLRLRSFAGLLLVLGCLLTTGDVMALGLGKMTVHSRLGANLQAEVELLAGAGEDRYAPECFRLAPPVDGTGLPVLTRASLTVERSGERFSLLVRSLQPVNEPVLLVSLRAGCGAEVVREYTLLIDGPAPELVKPVVAAREAVTDERSAPVARASGRSAPRVPEGYPERWEVQEGDTALSIANTLFPRQPKARARFLHALLAANPDVELGKSGDVPLMAGQLLQIPDTRRAPPAGRANRVDRAEPAAREQKPVRRQQKAADEPDTLPIATNTGGMSDRLSLSGASPDEDREVDEWSLRLSTELSSERVNTVTESQRSILRLEYKLLAAIYDQANQQLSLAEQVRQLEASVADLRAVTERSLNAPEGGPSGQSPDAKSGAAPAVVPQKPDSTSDSRMANKPDGFSSNWIWLAGLLVVVALLVWLLRRGSHRPAPNLLTVPDQTAEADETLLLSEPGYSAPQRKPASRPMVRPAADAPIPAEREAPRDLPPLSFSPPSQQGASVVIEHDEFDPVMELAEIMLAFGRVKGAIEALQEYIDNHPDGAIQPWMKLIEIYCQNSMRAEYEALVPAFQKHFNVSPPEWAGLPEIAPQPAPKGDEENCAVAGLLARTPNLTAQPEVRDAIVLQWGAGPQDTLVYLNALLRDNNNATYQGCSLSMVNELLYLLTILEQRLSRAG